MWEMIKVLMVALMPLWIGIITVVDHKFNNRER